MLKALKNKKDFRKKLLITLGILAVIQIASGIPTPGVNTAYFRLLLKSNGTLGMLNALSGNGLQSLSITMLSITPYITSSIILQLMCSIIPSLGEIQKDGETGRKKFKMYTVIFGAALAAIEAVGFAVGFGQRGLLLSYKWYWIQYCNSEFIKDHCAIIGLKGTSPWKSKEYLDNDLATSIFGDKTKIAIKDKDKCKLYQVPYILEIGDEDGSFNDIKQKFKYLEKTL